MNIPGIYSPPLAGRGNRRGQVSAELGVAMVIAATLLYFCAAVFAWLNVRMAARQQYYETHGWYGRARATQITRFVPDGYVPVDEAALPQLDMFNWTTTWGG